jgi:hypothetical protein
MAWVYNDGGRAASGFRSSARDCVCRAITIATELPYAIVYAALNQNAKTERPRYGGKRSSAGSGVKKLTTRRFLEANGWKWIPTMSIGSGAQVHLCEEELPKGRLIVSVSKHLTVVIDHIIHDTYDPQRASIVSKAGEPQRIARRCVYGYFIKNSENHP